MIVMCGFLLHLEKTTDWISSVSVEIRLNTFFFACIKMINSNGMANFISQKWSRHTVRKHIWRDEPNTWDYHWLLVLICDYLRAHKDRERVVMNVADRRRLNESDCMFCVCAFQFDSVCLFFVSACTHSKSSKIKPNVN